MLHNRWSFRHIIFGVGIFLFAFQATRSQAEIYTYGYSGQAQFTVNSTGGDSFTFNNPQASSGMLQLGIATDATPSDPILTINGSVNNQSAFVWTGYILNIGMNQTFQINSASVTSPTGWMANITQPTGPDLSGNYTGTIDYFVTSGGTPVAIAPAQNSTFSFGYQIQFNSTTSFSVTQSAMPVPEPGAMSLLLVGVSLFIGGIFFRRCPGRALITK